MAEIDVRQDLVATLIFRAHSVQLYVFVFSSTIPPSPSALFSLPESQFQQEEVPVLQGSLSPTSCSQCCSLWISPKPRLAAGLWQCGALQQTLPVQLLQAALGLGAQTCPPAAQSLPEPRYLQTIYKRLGSFVANSAAKRALNSQHACKTPSDPGNVLGTSFLL